MDFDADALDTYAGGAFARSGAGLRLWKRVGLELVGDIHVWCGGDSRQIQAAWAASAGVSLAVSF